MMMHDTDIRTAIANGLAASIGSDWPASAAALLHTLGYRSERLLDEQSGDAGDFIRQLPAPTPGAASERTFQANAQSLHIVSQITDDEIRAAMLPRPPDAAGFDTGNIRSFMFVAVELRGNAYARGEYAAFTREINKRWQIPTVVLFRTAANLVTLAFVHRRPHRRDPERDVLGSVFLIREINPANPHRADLDSLADLSLRKRLDWLEIYHRPRNFDGLLAAWLKALDTEELNRKFYRELFQWFERAVDVARFPDGQARTLEPEWHVIRLITRLMFVWFIKEKGLVAEELFVESQVRQLLKNYDRADGDSYYRAVLQNLFFATLNTPLADRGFSAGGNSAHRVFSRYRYRREMADPDGLTALFGKTPFINGGLFDCLDSVVATRDGGYRIDCFSDNHAHRQLLSIPNRLFFNDPHDNGADDNDPDDNEADDNDADDDGADDAGADAGIGLIDLFNRYQFTVEENTPAEQEVALDPELLGKVFENLLAAVNPETRENARKQTGSYYTPRAVVDYMVDEALTATLSQKAFPDDGDYTLWQDRLRYLLDYDDAPADANTPFLLDERKAIVRAIAQTRVLDPAVGSGAFPMGILHKLTLALRRLDADNSIWASIQREQARARADAAFDTDDRAARDAELDEISDIFERYRDSDFGRKLYLIQNSIYGVDIQSIATQIAKLRFFISLAIEQKASNDAADNYGIKPLPNLETRFVAADTLLPLDKPAQMALGQTDAVERLRRELAANREQYFHANNRDAKKRRRDDDQDLRQQLADALQDDGFPAGSARQIIAWEPFDQSANPAEWFDAEYMFGVTDGFDVVISNPPYGITVKDRRSAAIGHNDSYTNFMGLAVDLAPNGIMAFITPTSWETGERFRKFRQYLFSKMALQSVLNLPYDVFDTPYVDTAITIAAIGQPPPSQFRLATLDKRAELDLTQIADYMTTADWSAVSSDPGLRVPLLDWAADLFGRVGAKATPLGKITSSKRGIEAYQFDILSNQEAGASPFFGGQVHRYAIQQSPNDNYVVVSERDSSYHKGLRIWTRRIVNRANRLMSALTCDDFVVKKDIYVTKPNFDDVPKMTALLAILNSSLMSFLYLSRSTAAVKDDFRQVTLSGLRELPIIFPDATAMSELAQLVASREKQAGDIADLERRIDAIIYDTYGVTEAEQDAIAEWLGRSG